MGWRDLGEWLSGSPLLGLAIGTPLLMLIAVAIGSAARRSERRGEAVGDEGLESSMVQAVLALLGLLMAFTFALAIDRFETRRVLVLQEANAIGTIYLRVQLLEEPHRARLSRLLADYTENRLLLGEAVRGQNAQLLAKNDALLVDLWAATVAAVPSVRDPGVSTTVIAGMNSLIDMDAARKMARLARVPPAVFGVLFTYLVVSAGVLGYALQGRRGGVVASFWLGLLTLFLLLVFDIDRPTSGGIREEQTAMVQLQASIRAQPPGVFDRFGAGTSAPEP